MPVFRALTLLLLLILPAAAQAEESWTINLKDVDLSVFVTQVSEITGESFILDPQVQGKVTVVSSTALSKKGVKDLFYSVLRVNGYAAIPAGKAVKIIPQANAMQEGGGALKDGGADQIVTRVVPVKNAAVQDLVKILRPMVARYGYIEGTDYNNALIINDRAENVARLTRIVEQLDRTPNRSVSTVVVPLRHASAQKVAELLKGLLADDKKGNAALAAAAPSIQADESLNALIIRADPEALADMQAVIAKLDVRRTQVLIEAAIVEITADTARALGVQGLFGDSAVKTGLGVTAFPNAGASIGTILSQLSTSGSTLAAANAGQGLTAAVGREDQFTFLIQALATAANANLLSTPSITTLDNQEAKIVVGQNVPFRTGEYTTNAAGGSNPFTTIKREDVGITLKVVPHIHEGDAVRLDVQQEVSSVDDTSVQTGAADLITNKRTIETTILADDGETIVLGGLIRDDKTKQVSSVPFLGDIPVIGYLFRSEKEAIIKRNLLVFLRPTILRDKEHAAKLAAESYRHLPDLPLHIEKEKPKPSGTERIFPRNPAANYTLPPEPKSLFGEDKPEPVTISKTAPDALPEIAPVAAAPAPVIAATPIRPAPVMEEKTYIEKSYIALPDTIPAAPPAPSIVPEAPTRNFARKAPPVVEGTVIAPRKAPAASSKTLKASRYSQPAPLYGE